MVEGILISLVLTIITVGVHFSFLRLTSDRLAGRGQRLIRRITILFTGVVAAHFIEIFIYALAYKLLIEQFAFGALTGPFGGDLADYVYVSAVNYTSLGFGDIVPLGDLRLVTGFEALTGLLMITWSASFTFLAMQRYWRL